MLIGTWNVNSIRTRLDQVKEWLQENQPDVLCLQETKVDDSLFPQKEFIDVGYNVSFYGQKAYNGVAILSKHHLEDIKFGFNGEFTHESSDNLFEEQKRIISAVINEIRIVNVYVPNGSSLSSDKYAYKLKWLQLLNQYLAKHKKYNEPLCLLGDFNIALEDNDIHNPKRLTGGIMASKEERKQLKSIIEGSFQDAFRLFEQGNNNWTWWDYRTGGWERDTGWRIDHIYLSEDLIRRAKGCKIHKNVRGNLKPSDHAPVVVDISWPPEEESSTEDIYDSLTY